MRLDRSIIRKVATGFRRRETTGPLGPAQIVSLNGPPPPLEANTYFIVEFPKSGITWLNMLVANAHLLAGGLSDTATFASIRSWIPDLAAHPTVVGHAFAPTGRRFYKMHSLYDKRFTLAIYLVRHPAAVMQSYHNYLQGLGRFDGTLKDLCESEKFGIETWRTHVRSWIFGPRNTINNFMHLIRYEDLVQDTAAELTALSDNFGWGMSSEIILEAVARCSKTTMQKQETLYFERNPAHRFTFVGGHGKTKMPEPLEDWISDCCKEELELLGY